MTTYQASFNKIRVGVGTKEDVANIQALIITKECEVEIIRKQSKKIEMLKKELKMCQKALDKACEILNEGYGEEYASFIYMKNLDERIEIPNNMTISQWKEWLLKDE